MNKSAAKSSYTRIRTALPLSIGFVRPPKVFIAPDSILIIHQRPYSEVTSRLHFTDIECVTARQDNHSLYSVPTNLVVCLLSTIFGGWLMVEGSAVENIPAIVIGVLWLSLSVFTLLKALVSLAAGRSMLLTISTATQEIELHLGARYLDRLLERYLVPSLYSAQGSPENLESSIPMLARGGVAPASRQIAEPEREPVSTRLVGIYLTFSIVFGVLYFASLFGPPIPLLDSIWMASGGIMVLWLLFVIVHVARHRASPTVHGFFVLCLWFYALDLFSAMSMEALVSSPQSFSGSFSAAPVSKQIHDVVTFVLGTGIELLLLRELLAYRHTFWGSPNVISFTAPAGEAS